MYGLLLLPPQHWYAVLRPIWRVLTKDNTKLLHRVIGCLLGINKQVQGQAIDRSSFVSEILPTLPGVPFLGVAIRAVAYCVI
jgi:hypothetical protein